MRYLGFMGVLFVLFFFNCLVGCLSTIVWTPAVLSVFYACVLHLCFCLCSAQLSMFHMERRSRNTLIIITKFCCGFRLQPGKDGRTEIVERGHNHGFPSLIKSCVYVSMLFLHNSSAIRW